MDLQGQVGVRMIELEALHKISYGLYIVSAGDKLMGNGFIANTFFQITSSPPQFAASCNKNNFTVKLIESSGAFAVSVLGQNTSSDLIGKFGYQSGQNIDKLAGMLIKYGMTGVPIVQNESLAFFECKLLKTIDMGTHNIYIGELIQSGMLSAVGEPLTYAYYHSVKKGSAPKNAPTYIDPLLLKSNSTANTGFKKYRCSVCGYIYDEEKGDPSSGIAAGTLFKDLPKDKNCPTCSADWEDFVEVTV